MWCTKRRVEPFKKDARPNNLNVAVMRTTEFLQPSPLDEFMFQEVEIDGKKSVTLTSDIYMLFNQQRLDKLSRERLVDYFNNLSVQQPKFSELRSNLTDSQLISFVKSRFIQSPSELMAWSNYLISSQDELVAAVAAELRAQQNNPVEPEPEPEPAPTPTE